MFKEILLDCSLLESPEPLNLVIQNLENIDKSTYIKMIHRMEPMVLYNILEQNTYLHKTFSKNNQVVIYIYKNVNIEEFLNCIQD